MLVSIHIWRHEGVQDYLPINISKTSGLEDRSFKSFDEQKRSGDCLWIAGMGAFAVFVRLCIMTQN